MSAGVDGGVDGADGLVASGLAADAATGSTADAPAGARRTERLFAAGGLVFLVLLGAGMLVCARLVPPPAPTLTADELLAVFRANTLGMRIGLQLVMVGAVFILPFVIVISRRLRAIEGPDGLWAQLQLACGVAAMFVFILPTTILQAALFRVDDIDPGVLRTLDDLAWILFVSTASLFCLQTLSVGMAVLGGGAQRVFPRWLGYFNLWVSLMSALGVTVPFFKTGPLAWDGLFTYWLALVAFGTFILVMSTVLLRGTRGDPAG